MQRPQKPAKCPVILAVYLTAMAALGSLCALASPPLAPEVPVTAPKDGSTAHQGAVGRCLSLHLHEAMALNKTRQPLYGRITEGASQGVSNLLILSESLALPMAELMEQWASPLVNKGVDIFCDVVVSMENTPAFGAPHPQNHEKPKSFQPWLGFGKIPVFFWRALTLDDRNLLKALDDQLGDLQTKPGLHCMQRHLLESVARAVYLAPAHRSKSAQIGYGLRGGFLVQTNIVSQILLLPFGFWLDYKAAPVQLGGVDLICNDVPEIPRGI